MRRIAPSAQTPIAPPGFLPPLLLLLKGGVFEELFCAVQVTTVYEDLSEVQLDRRIVRVAGQGHLQQGERQ
jgi:hypothetical protein